MMPESSFNPYVLQSLFETHADQVPAPKFFLGLRISLSNVPLAVASEPDKSVLPLPLPLVSSASSQPLSVKSPERVSSQKVEEDCVQKVFKTAGDQLLLYAVKVCGDKNWQRVADTVNAHCAPLKMEKVSSKQCHEHYLTILSHVVVADSPGVLAPASAKRKLTEEEPSYQDVSEEDDSEELEKSKKRRVGKKGSTSFESTERRKNERIFHPQQDDALMEGLKQQEDQRVGVDNPDKFVRRNWTEIANHVNQKCAKKFGTVDSNQCRKRHYMLVNGLSRTKRFMS